MDCERRQERCRNQLAQLLEEKEKRYQAEIRARDVNQQASYDEVLRLVMDIRDEMWMEEALDDKIDERVSAVVSECLNGPQLERKINQAGKISIPQMAAILCVVLGWFAAVAGVWVDLDRKITVNEQTNKRILHELTRVGNEIKTLHSNGRPSEPDK